MKTILEIYKHYKIMPMLETHQLRVAAVAAMICDNIDAVIDQSEIISACLLHDMGNIIKFDLEQFPDAVEPLGLEYWQDVQRDYKSKWPDEHTASIEIAKEIGVNRITLDLIANIGISKSHIVAANSDNINQKIGTYSDMRVAPHGVIPLLERLADLDKRYAKKFYGLENDEKKKMWRDALLKIESDIFSQATITPNQINDGSVESYLPKLKKFRVV